jgi:hypothetical protein
MSKPSGSTKMTKGAILQTPSRVTNLFS